MELMLFIGNDFIASVPLNGQMIALPGYIGGLKRELLAYHAELVQMASDKPQFWIADLSINAQDKNNTTKRRAD
jgi:hypothetical protein